MTAAAPRSDAAASPSGAAAAPRSDAAAPQPHPGPWAGVRVVDFSGLAGAYGTRVWAALGAEVIAVEPPDGNLLRTIPPLHPELTGPEAGLWWAYYGAGKASVVLDPDDPHDAATLAELAASADVVVDDSPPALQDRPGWGRADSQRRNPALTWVSVTPFGMTGPHRDWAGSDLIAWAACGLASTVGFPDRPPLAPAAQVQLLMHVASMDVVLGAMLALRGRDRGAPGQRIDVSLQEVGLSIAPETGVPLYLDDQAERPRAGNRRPVTSPMGLYPASDGFVSLIAIQPNHWNAVAKWIHEETGNEGVLDPAFVNMATRMETLEAVDAWTEEVTTAHTKLELFVEGQRRGIPITPVNTVADLRGDPHLEAVGWWRREEHPTLGTYTVPGSPFMTDGDWWAWTRAPLLGEHTEQVCEALTS